jgi:hypothetical protein
LLADPARTFPVAHLGEFRAEPGGWQIDGNGRRCPWIARGFEHRLE